MWLDGGVWNGKQIVSKEWIGQMSSKQANGGDYGYGYQVWMCKYPSAVRADGALGQYVIVVPEKDVVIVLTEASFTNGKPQRNLIWDNFLPQLVDEPLPASKDYQTLLAKQAAYTLEIPAGKDKSSVMKKLAGKKISVPKNKYGWKEVVFEQGTDKQLLMHLTKTDGITYTQPMGYKKWSTCEIAGLPPYSINPIDWHRGLEGPFYGAACYGWEKNVLNANIHYVNWVTSLYTTWEVKEGEIILSISNNYAKNKVEKFTCKVE